MTFGRPWALLLFALLPALIFISRGRLIHLSPLRRGLAIGLRIAIFGLLVLALADARRSQNADNLSVVFLVDQSDSVGLSGNEEAIAFIQAALQSPPPDDTAGVIAFGANALVEELPQIGLKLNDIASTPSAGYTNFADAIRLGMAIFPPDSPKRLILLSDGQNNLGDAKSAAQLAAAAGIELSTLALPRQSGPEVRLQSLRAPSALHEREGFDLTLNVESNTATSADVQLFADGQLIALENVNIQPGSNRFAFPLLAGAQGFSSWQARLVPQEDTLAQNNRLDAFSLIEGPLQVLVVAAKEIEARPLVDALSAAGLRPQLVSPRQLPASPLTLSQYAAVALVNAPAPLFSPAQLELLQAYVRDLGNGLVVIGGPESYGAGGYFQTPLEETLPVEMTLKDRERLPGMSMFMVIDKSGSMESSGTQGMGGLRKIELAKEAVYRAVDLLAPWDRVGVVSFDNAARWVVNPVAVVGAQRIKDQVGTLRASGGTDILAGLQAAADLMKGEVSRVKHIVLLTDGGANPAGIPELVDELAANDVSVSVVAIGDDAAPFLKELAERGNGRFHLARDASAIPQIFAQEAALATRAYIIEEEVTPKLSASSPILQGLTALPKLYGYIATSPKATAQTALVSDRDDPLLAQWQYGLGRSVAWTSDAWGRWAKDWAAWEGFARFWGQTVRWTIVEGASGRLEVQAAPDREKGVTRLSVEALDAQGKTLNNLDALGRLLAPGLAQEDVIFQQTAPGLYQAEIRPDETGAYLLRVQGRDKDGKLVSNGTRGFVVNYSPEYAGDIAEPGLMRDLAELGGGRALTTADAAEVFAHTLPPVSGSSPLWPLLLTLAALLLPVDVGLRRIIVGREELQKLWQKTRSYLPRRQSRAAAPPSSPASSSAGKLLSSVKKQRVSRRAGEKVGRGESEPVSRGVEEQGSRGESGQVNKGGVSSSVKPVSPPKKDEAEDRMSRLLKAKRRAGKATNDE
ncbi:MAG TPA: VWA domain-containing protein [Chloroflexi bacterium]|nr:VWA domain-containing protein [Chloroflexota bacterium]